MSFQGGSSISVLLGRSAGACVLRTTLPTLVPVLLFFLCRACVVFSLSPQHLFAATDLEPHNPYIWGNCSMVLVKIIGIAGDDIVQPSHLTHYLTRAVSLLAYATKDTDPSTAGNAVAVDKLMTRLTKIVMSEKPRMQERVYEDLLDAVTNVKPSKSHLTQPHRLQDQGWTLGKSKGVSIGPKADLDAVRRVQQPNGPYLLRDCWEEPGACVHPSQNQNGELRGSLVR